MDCARDAFGAVAEAAATTVDVFTPLTGAVAELQRRRAHTDLRQQVEEFFDGDIPDYLRGPAPVLYLARHVATPNFETLRFAELTRPFGLPMVIGQDTQDKFVAHNAMKRALGKLTVQRNVCGDVRHFTIIDFATAQGQRLSEIFTLHGQPLIEFHARLMHAAPLHDVQVADDAQWIGRQQRGDLPEHYKRFLALFVAHAVMLENYEAEDAALLHTVIEPAFAFAERQFGVRPLIANLAEGVAPPVDWNAYPERFCVHICPSTPETGKA